MQALASKLDLVEKKLCVQELATAMPTRVQGLGAVGGWSLSLA